MIHGDVFMTPRDVSVTHGDVLLTTANFVTHTYFFFCEPTVIKGGSNLGCFCEPLQCSVNQLQPAARFL